MQGERYILRQKLIAYARANGTKAAITSTDTDKRQTTVIRLTDSMLSSIAWCPLA